MTLILALSGPPVHIEIISDHLWPLGVMDIEEQMGDLGLTVLPTTLGQDRHDSEHRIKQVLTDLGLRGVVEFSFRP